MKKKRPYANETFTKEAAEKVAEFLRKKGRSPEIKLARGKSLGKEKLYHIYD